MTVARYYVTADAMGSATAILDEDGNVLERRSYEAFGEVTCMLPDGSPVEISPTGVDVGFQGQVRDDFTGLYLMGYRWYNQSIGRWLSRDPIGLHGGINSNLFVLNRPTDDSDSLGLKLDTKAMGTIAELFPKEAEKMEKVMRGLLARFDSAERKEANKLLAEALECAPVELRNKALESIFEVVMSAADWPTPNDTPADLIPGVATSVYFVFCEALRQKHIKCMMDSNCNVRKCEPLAMAAQRCFVLASKAASILK